MYIYTYIYVHIYVYIHIYNIYNIYIYVSSGKRSDPRHFLKSQGKFFCSFLYTLFFMYFRPEKL